MQDSRLRRHRRSIVVGLAAAGGLLISLPTHAAVVHVYDFNNNTIDSVGGANATLVNGATVNATSLVTNGTGSGSGNTSPNATLPANAVAGLGNYSLEQFYTRAAAGGNFQSLFSFAVGADAPAQQNNYLVATPNRGSATGVMSVAYKQAGFNLGAERLLQGPSGVIGVETYIANTYDIVSGQATLHVDGALRDGFRADYFAGFSLAGKNTRLGVNGNGPFPDNSLNGSTNEFRLYDNVESATTIAIRYLGGNTANNPVVVNDSTASGDYATTAFASTPTATQHVRVIGHTVDVTNGTNTAGLLSVSGTVNVNGGTLTSATNIDLVNGGVINLNTGGTLAVKGVTGSGQAYATSGGGTINLNGGTLTGVAAAQANQGFAYLGGPNVTLNAVNGSTTTVNTSTGRITIASTITGNGTIAQTTSNDLFLQGNISGFTGTLNIAPATANGGVTVFAPVARTSANPIQATVTMNNFGFIVFSGQNSDYVTGNISGGLNGTSIRKNDFGTLTFANNTVAVNGEIVANGRTSLAFINNNTTVGTATNNGQIGLLDNGVIGEARKITVQNSTLNTLTTSGRFLFTDTGGNQETRYLELLGGATIGSGLPLFVKGRTTNETFAGMTAANRVTSGLTADNVAGNNAIQGGISIRATGGGYSVRSQAGTLTIGTAAGGDTYNNVTDVPNPNRILELTGAGNGIFAGLIRDGTVANDNSRMGIAVIGGTDGTTTSNVGSWTLANANNTFRGGITVVNGTLLVDGATTSTSTIASNAANVYGGTLGGTGALAQAITVFASGATISIIPGQSQPAATVQQTTGTGGTIAPGNAATPIESLATGALTINGRYAAQVDSTGSGTSDVLNVTGNVTLGANSVLDVAVLAGTMDDVYIIGTYTGTLSGTFGTVNAGGFTVDYNYLGLNQIALVPEPATLAALGTLGAMLVGRRRR